MKFWTSWVVISALIFSSSPALAADGARAMSDDQYYSRISEYFFSPTGKEVLIPVQILGNVSRPGLYHIPAGTSLTTLLAISGGTAERANTSKIRLFREGETQKLNLDDVLEKNPNFALQHKDTLYIPEKPKWVDDNTMTTIMAISAIATTVLTVYWIRNEERR